MLDDPVRMYLKQMARYHYFHEKRKSKFLNVLKLLKLLHSSEYMLFINRQIYLDISQKLIEREERFDRVVLDKKIDSREGYFKVLAKQVDALTDLNKKLEMLGAVLLTVLTPLKRNEHMRFKKYEAELEPILKCCLKLKVFEDYLQRSTLS